VKAGIRTKLPTIAVRLLMELVAKNGIKSCLGQGKVQFYTSFISVKESIGVVIVKPKDQKREHTHPNGLTHRFKHIFLRFCLFGFQLV
jgi:hypothetical protein